MTWDNFGVRLEGGGKPGQAEDVIRDLPSATPEAIVPAVNEGARQGLKFSECLPPDLAAGVVQARLADPAGVAAVLRQPLRTVFEG